MKILKTECFSLELPLKEEYSIAYESISVCHALFLVAHTDKGLTGFGSAAPDLAVTGESASDSLQKYSSVLEPVLKNASCFSYIRIMEELKEGLSQNPSLLAMADMMLYDLVAKKAGVPLYEYLGGYRTSIPTSITIPVLELTQTLNKAGEYYNEGFRIFKLKGGINPDEDIEKVIRLRESFGREISLRFDANQGYSVEEAIRFVNETKEQNVELLEQPTPRYELQMLGKVSSSVNIPVMADESILSLRDVFRLTKDDLTDMINIKLMKAGGITEGLQINAVARSAGVETMVGCMDESELSIAAGLHFALSRPNIIYADLDGHLDLSRDPASGTLLLRNGILYPNSKPGLGIDNLNF